MGGEAGRAPSGGLRSCVFSRTDGVDTTTTGGNWERVSEGKEDRLELGKVSEGKEDRWELGKSK